MTRKEFESLRAEIQQQKFTMGIECNPLQYATRRAEFRVNQLRKLIEIGRTIKDPKTVQTKIARWERQVKRYESVPQRMAMIANSTSRAQVG